MKKILFIHHAVGWGGAPNSMIQLINNLDKTRYEITVLLLKHSNIVDKLKENRINYRVSDSAFYKKHYHYFPHSEAGYIKWHQIYKFLKLSSLWILSRYIFASKELSKHEFDIVHFNSSVLTDWLFSAKKKGKVILHIREPFRKGKIDGLYLVFTSQMRKYTDKIIAISEDNANRIRIPEKTEVIYNFSAIPNSSLKENSFTSNKFLYLGGAAYIKGFYTIIEALDYLQQDVKIYFCGNYSTKSNKNKIRQTLKNLFFTGEKKTQAIARMQNHPNAIEIGMTNNTQEFLEEICCLISPHSVPHFSRPAMEAHLNRKPVIASDVEGMDEIVIHLNNGLIVPRNNPIELALAINKITNDSKLAQAYGKSGFDTAIVKFSNRNAQKVENLYNILFP